MAVLTILTYFLPGLVVYWILWIIYARWFHPCSTFPGPFLASVSRLWLVGQVLRNNVDEEEKELHRKYGPIVRVAPDQVIIADASAFKTIYGINSGFTKTDFYEVFMQPWQRQRDLFTIRNEPHYATRRKITAPVYTMSNVVRHERAIDTCSHLLTTALRTLASPSSPSPPSSSPSSPSPPSSSPSSTSPPQKGNKGPNRQEPTDLALWIRYYSFDVIGALFFSRPFGFLAQRTDLQGWIRAGDALTPVLTVLGVAPSYTRPLVQLGSVLMPWLWTGLWSMVRMGVAAGRCVEERRREVEEGRGGKGEGKKGEEVKEGDMLGELMRVWEEKGKEVMYEAVEVKSEILTALVVGSDTTATEITAILYFLLKNPAAYRKLRDEIDTATADGKLSVPHVKYSEAAKLPYLDACCKEGMRLMPALGMALPREVPPGGREIAGHFFPGGVKVGINATTLHRDKSVFGEDAAEFNPERWFRKDVGNMEKHMMHFGAGTRICVGKNIALCEIYKIIPELLRSFDFELAEPDADWTHADGWLHKVSDVYTKVTVREAGNV